MRHPVCVKRTTITLPDDVDARLRLEARRRGSSIADVAREAIERQLPPAPSEGELSFFSIGEGSPRDASECDELVAKAVARRE
jgi:hypothetical protein